MEKTGISMLLVVLGIITAFGGVSFAADSDVGASFEIIIDRADITEGETAILRLAGSNLNDLYSYEVVLAYDPQIVKLEGAQSGVQGFPVGPFVNGGRAKFAFSKTGDVPGESGSITLAEFTLLGLSAGISDLKLESVVAFDSHLSRSEIYTGNAVSLSVREKGGVSDNGPTSPPAATPETSRVSVNANGHAIISVGAILSDSGLMKAGVSTELLDQALGLAKADSNGTKTVILEFPERKIAESCALEIPVSYLRDANSQTRFVVTTVLGTIVLPGNMFDESLVANAERVTLFIGKADVNHLDGNIRNQIGSKPAIELTIQVDNKPVVWRNPDATVTVSIPYVPTEEERIKREHITVWFIDASGRAYSVPTGKFDPGSGMVTFKTTHFSKYAVVHVSKTFSDIADSWAREEIEVLASKGVINGTTDTTYGPDRNITRADFMVLLVKALGLTASVTNPFIDVNEDDYYHQEVTIAKKLGIIEGIGGNKFNPNTKITRQDMMVIVARALKATGKLDGDTDLSALDRFKDRSEIDVYAQASVASLVNAGIVAVSDTRLHPVNHVTREEAARLIYTIYHL